MLLKLKEFWLDAVLNSFSVYFFLTDPRAALPVWLALACANWWLAASGLISCITANIFALCVLPASRDQGQMNRLGLNAVLLGFMIGANQPPTPAMPAAIVLLSCACVVLLLSAERVLQPLGLTASTFPALSLHLLWKLGGLSDALGAFPPMPAGAPPPPVQKAVDLEAALHCVLAGAGNYYFLPPVAFFLVTASVLWLLTVPSVLFAFWGGAALGVASDLAVGAPAAHTLSGMSGCNSALVLSVVALTCQPRSRSFLLGAGFAIFATVITRQVGASHAGTWPAGLTVFLFQGVQSAMEKGRAGAGGKKED